MKNTIMLLMLPAFILITGCNRLAMNNEEAEGLIKTALNLPQSYRADIGAGPGYVLDALKGDGLITYYYTYAFFNTYIKLSPTDKCKPYYLGKDSKDSNINKFKTNDFDFDKITGISINKESQTATVRFSLKATNITPIAYTLKRVDWISYPLDSPIHGELIFKKFDSGWQLQSVQNKSGTELLNQILKAN